MLDRAKRTATLHFDHTYVAVMRDCGVDSAEERLQDAESDWERELQAMMFMMLH